LLELSNREFKTAEKTAEVRISVGYSVTYNDAELTAVMLPSLHAGAAPGMWS